MPDPKPAPAARRRVPVAQINLVVVPAVIYYLYFCVAWNAGGLLPGPSSDWTGFASAVAPTTEAFAVFVAWFAFQAALHVLLPGRVVEGLPLEDGTRLCYRMNGLAATIVSFGAVAAGHALGWFSLTWIHDEFGALITGSGDQDPAL